MLSLQAIAMCSHTTNDICNSELCKWNTGRKKRSKLHKIKARLRAPPKSCPGLMQSACTSPRLFQTCCEACLHQPEGHWVDTGNSIGPAAQRTGRDKQPLRWLSLNSMGAFSGGRKAEKCGGWPHVQARLGRGVEPESGSCARS